MVCFVSKWGAMVKLIIVFFNIHIYKCSKAKVLKNSCFAFLLASFCPFLLNGPHFLLYISHTNPMCHFPPSPSGGQKMKERFPGRKWNLYPRCRVQPIAEQHMNIRTDWFQTYILRLSAAAIWRCCYDIIIEIHTPWAWVVLLGLLYKNTHKIKQTGNTDIIIEAKVCGD